MAVDNDINLSRYSDGQIKPPLHGNYPQCQLLLGWFPRTIQVVLGFMTISSLIIKRQWERVPKRPYKVWIFDVGKQASAGILIHVLNILIASAIANDDANLIDTTALPVSECAWYLVNYMVDMIIGTALVMGMLRIVALLSGCAHFTPLIKLGDYGDPPRTCTWIVQLTVYLACWVLAKACVTALLFSLGSQIAFLAVVAFAPLESHPRLELIVVMVVGPILLNTLWFWLVDNFLMGKTVSTAFADLFAIICCSTKRPGELTNRYSELPSARSTRDSVEGNGTHGATAVVRRSRSISTASKSSSSDTDPDSHSKDQDADYD